LFAGFLGIDMIFLKETLNRISAVAIKEIKEIVRVRLFLMLAFIVPFIMFNVFSFGISLDNENMPFAYIDYDKSQLSAKLVEKFKNRYFDLKHELTDLKNAEMLLSSGKLRAVMIIPSDFSKSIYRGNNAQVQFLIDGGYPFRAITIRGYCESILSAFNTEMAIKKYKGKLLTTTPLRVETRYLYNESLKSSYALVPSMIAVILLMNPAVLTALAISREKEMGTIYNIYSTPIKKWEFLTGKIIPYLIISAINFILLVITVRLLFHIPMKGNFIDLVPGAIVYVLINVSIGLLVSSVTRTMVAAQIVTVIVTVIPAFLYSGLLVPVANLEGGAKIIARLYPTMHFMKIIHGVYLKKLNMVDLLPHLLFMILYFAILFTLGVTVFKKREG
jgi:ABC-2 type transport system permease protein/ribosome-dependent ATPase